MFAGGGDGAEDDAAAPRLRPGGHAEGSGGRGAAVLGGCVGG